MLVVIIEGSIRVGCLIVVDTHDEQFNRQKLKAFSSKVSKLARLKDWC